MLWPTFFVFLSDAISFFALSIVSVLRYNSDDSFDNQQDSLLSFNQFIK